MSSTVRSSSACNRRTLFNESPYVGGCNKPSGHWRPPLHGPSRRRCAGPGPRPPRAAARLCGPHARAAGRPAGPAMVRGKPWTHTEQLQSPTLALADFPPPSCAHTALRFHAETQITTCPARPPCASTSTAVSTRPLQQNESTSWTLANTSPNTVQEMS